VTAEAVNADSLMAARIRQALKVDAGADVVSRDNQVANSCRVLPVSRQDRPTCKG
jgi:hypothetical protein